MVTIRYTPPRDLELSGDRAALAFIAAGINRLVRDANGSARFVANPDADPAPYSTLLGMLRVRVVEELLHVLVIGSHLVITGNPEALDALATVLSAAATGSSGSHIHLEYHDGHPKIAVDSLPLVVVNQE